MNDVFHSVKLIDENCIGCNQCMIHCPVQAVRLKNSKAVIYNDRCIDCGECIKFCPHNAYVAQKNSLDVINDFKVKIAVPSITIYTQFGSNVSPGFINEAIKSLGFDEVFSTSYGCEIVGEICREEIKRLAKPAISPFCPTVVRLIESNYPELMDNIIRVLDPIEVAAGLIREKYRALGYANEEIGIFFLSSCVTWITRAKYTSLQKDFEINYSIAISDLYPSIIKYMNKNQNEISEVDTDISYSGMLWSIIGGHSEAMGIDEYLAVDGIENVIKVLEDIEKGKFKDVDYIEAAACTGGCAGGLLTVENPFNAKRILNKYRNKLKFSSSEEEIKQNSSEKFKTSNYLEKCSNQSLAEDFQSAVKKMKYMNNLINMLPGIDCGQCGSPTCKAFAEDVVRGLAFINECSLIKDGGNIYEG